MELTLDQALQKGIEAHKAGKVEEADRYYTAILKAQPKHPDANHNMGALAVGVGKVEQALPFLKTALEANSNITQFWLSYIDALIKLDRMVDAKAVLDQAKSNGAKGDGFDQLERRLGSLKEAPAVKSSNVQNPPKEQLDSLVELYNQQKLHQVFEKTQLLTKTYANNLVLWNLMGASAAQIGQLDEAVIAFQNAITIKPDFAEAYYNLGMALQERGKLIEAMEAFKKAISIPFIFFRSLRDLSNAFFTPHFTRPVASLPFRTSIITIVTAPKCFSPLWIIPFDLHIRISEIHLNDISFFVFYVNRKLFRPLRSPKWFI